MNNDGQIMMRERCRPDWAWPLADAWAAKMPLLMEPRNDAQFLKQF